MKGNKENEKLISNYNIIISPISEKDKKKEIEVDKLTIITNIVQEGKNYDKDSDISSIKDIGKNIKKKKIFRKEN